MPGFCIIAITLSPSNDMLQISHATTSYECRITPSPTPHRFQKHEEKEKGERKTGSLALRPSLLHPANPVLCRGLPFPSPRPPWRPPEAGWLMGMALLYLLYDVVPEAATSTF